MSSAFIRSPLSYFLQVRINRLLYILEVIYLCYEECNAENLGRSITKADICVNNVDFDRCSLTELTLIHRDERILLPTCKIDKCNL